MTQVHICCGVGGTGKTTTAAAMGLAWAATGARTVVLTIDPARRLADALGLETLDNVPRAVGDSGMHAMMLDRKATWDAIIRRFSKDPDKAEKLLDNRYYRAVSTRLTGSHEYMAIEKLHELVHSGDWDVVVVDTPPARHVLDFFEAPERVRKVFDRGVVRTLVQPSGGLFSGASQRAMGVVRRLAGERVLADVAEFFSLVADLSGGFRARHAEVAELLRSESTTYWLVASADAPERNDLAAFLDVLSERGMHLGGTVLNRCAPTAPDLTDHSWPLGDAADSESWQLAIEDLVARQEQRHAEHEAAAERLAELAGRPVYRVPELHNGLRTLPGLRSLARHLPPEASPTRS